MFHSNFSLGQTQTHPRAFLRYSIDSVYLCPDFSHDLEETSPKPVSGGMSSDVYKYKDRLASPPIYYAIKWFRYQRNLGLPKHKAERRIQREIESWRRLRHPNILRLEGILYRTEGDFPCLVSPWMNNGTARDYVKETKGIKLLSFVSGISDGLSFMHQKNIAHGDLRGDNILVSENGQALICDFGLAKIIEDLAPGMTASSIFGHGATHYRAPEFFEKGGPRKPTTSGDIWTFGMTFLELWSGQIPFSSINSMQVTLMLINKALPDFSAMSPERADFKACKERVFSICSLCWILDPENRPPMVTIAALMKALASEKKSDGYKSTDDEEAEQSGPANDSGLDMTESPDNLSVADSPRISPRNPESLADRDNGSPAFIRSEPPTPPLSPSNPSKKASASFSSLLGSISPSVVPQSPPSAHLPWPSDLPKPPAPSLDGILQDEGTVFKQVLNVYKLKKQVPIQFALTQQGPDHQPFWKSTCIIGSEEYGTASSRQKKVAEEESARKATARLRTEDLDGIAQCLTYFPVLREHLKKHGLSNRVQFNNPTAHPSDRAFVCEVRRDGVKVCEGSGPSKAEAQEKAARVFATGWRQDSL